LNLPQNHKVSKMNTYKYQLEKSPKKKGTCPQCQKPHVFRHYENTETGERLPEKFGRCDRENNCGYHLMPNKENFDNRANEPKEYRKMTFENGVYTIKFNFNTEIIEAVKQIKGSKYDGKNHWWTVPENLKTEIEKFALKFGFTVPVQKRLHTLDNSVAEATFRLYEHNYFVQFMYSRFDKDLVRKTVENYHIGTAKRNATLFWYYDIENRIRTAKRMLYRPDAHRDKNGFIFFIHKEMEKELQPDEEFRICFFGEHLLAANDKIVAIVESEKSAVIASMFYPDYVWLASGGANGLTKQKTAVLKDRKVLIVPDLDNAGRKAYEKKLTELKIICHSCQILDFAPEINNQKDIADYLLGEVNL